MRLLSASVLAAGRKGKNTDLLSDARLMSRVGRTKAKKGPAEGAG